MSDRAVCMCPTAHPRSSGDRLEAGRRRPALRQRILQLPRVRAVAAVLEARARARDVGAVQIERVERARPRSALETILRERRPADLADQRIERVRRQRPRPHLTLDRLRVPRLVRARHLAQQALDRVVAFDIPVREIGRQLGHQRFQLAQHIAGRRGVAFDDGRMRPDFTASARATKPSKV